MIANQKREGVEVTTVEVHRFSAGFQPAIACVENELFEGKARRHFSARPHDLLMPVTAIGTTIGPSVMHGGVRMASKASTFRRMPWRLLGWSIAAALLLLPLVAGAPWTPSDYIFAATVFGIVGGAFELAVRRSGSGWYRAGAAVALATAFLLVWINAAVGIIGSEGNAANAMFLVVILVAAAGAVVARFEASGMARAMALAAAAETIVGAIAFAFRLGANAPPFFPGVILLIGFFALTWLLSAWLFRRTAQEKKRSA